MLDLQTRLESLPLGNSLIILNNRMARVTRRPGQRHPRLTLRTRLHVSTHAVHGNLLVTECVRAGLEFVRDFNRGTVAPVAAVVRMPDLRL
jgi:hypothetical protein